MRVFAIIAVALMLLLPALSLAAGITDFQGGRKEAVLTLAAPSFEATVNLTVPVKYHVLNATFNVTGMAAEGDPSVYPENISVVLNDTAVWAFNGTGYGPFGRQDRFSDGAGAVRVQFPPGGGTKGFTVRLPKGANVQNATIDLKALLPKHWEELINFTGGAAGDQMAMCAAAGDVNNDGYDDVIIGAGGNDTGGKDAGQAYIHFGGPNMNLTPDLTFTGAGAGNVLGFFVSGAGDVNGDGYDDVIVGAPSYNSSGGTDPGQVYIYFGGPEMDSVADVVLTGEAAGDNFGCVAQEAGDVNGDGYDDVIIGADGNDAGGIDAGRAYIFFGGRDMRTVADVTFTGSVGDILGWVASGAGDVNNDGYDDVIVGAPLNDTLNDTFIGDVGKAYVYFGGQNMNNGADVTLSGNGLLDQLGRCVSGAGDVNGDGYDDVVIGAVESDNGSAGRVEVFLGDQKMDSKPDVVLKGAGEGDFFGWNVWGAGDVNNDGLDDVIVGTPFNDTIAGGEDSGRAYIFYGGRSMDDKWDAAFDGHGPNEQFGHLARGAGDVNNDGYIEVLIGASGNDEGGIDSGRVYLYSQVDDAVPGLLYPSLSIGAASIWEKTAYFNGSETTSDFAQALNDYLRSAKASGSDGFGYSYVDIPINVSAGNEGNLLLRNLKIVYDYEARIPDFADALNDYIAAHRGEADATGNLFVPVKVRSESAGRVKLSGLNIRLDLPPALVRQIGTVEMDEDTVNSTLVDLWSIFEDESDPHEVLDFSVVSATNSGIVAMTIKNNRYLSADALTGEDNDNWTGTVEAVVACTDPRGQTTESNRFNIVVRNVNDPPIMTSSPFPAAEPGIPYSYDVTALDGDRDVLHYRLAKAPPNMTIDSENGKILWMPSSGGIKDVDILVDDGNAAAEQKFTMMVPNRPPVVASSPVLEAEPGVPYIYNVVALDRNQDVLHFRLANAPANMTIDTDKGTIQWMPRARGPHDITVLVDDGNATAEQQFAVVVPNRPPEITSAPPLNASIGASYLYNVTAGDPNRDVLTFSLLEGPDGMRIRPDTGAVTWTPGAGGDFKVVIEVWDGEAGAIHAFTVKVAMEGQSTASPVAAAGAIVSIVVVICLIAVAGTEAGKYKLIALFIPLYTRLHGEEVLDNETRGMIRGCIISEPGIHLMELRRRLGLSNGAAVHHLQTLEREGIIQSRSDGRLRRFYPAGMKLVDMPVKLNYLQNGIFNMLREREGRSQKEMAEVLEVYSSTVSRQVKKMAAMGVLRLERHGMTVKCYINEEWRAKSDGETGGEAVPAAGDETVNSSMR